MAVLGAVGMEGQVGWRHKLSCNPLYSSPQPAEVGVRQGGVFCECKHQPNHNPLVLNIMIHNLDNSCQKPTLDYNGKTIFAGDFKINHFHYSKIQNDNQLLERTKMTYLVLLLFFPLWRLCSPAETMYNI